MIKEKREQAGLTSEQLAHMIGCSKGTISHIENGKPISDKKFITVMRLSKVLGIDATEFADVSNIRELLPRAITYTRQIKLYKLENIGILGELHKDDVSPDGMQIISIQGDLANTLSESGCAFEVDGNDNYPEFLAGDQIIIDPEAPYYPGEMVVFKMKSSDTGQIRKYKPITDTIFHMVPINDDYPTIVIDEENKGQIVGPIVTHIRDPRKK